MKPEGLRRRNHHKQVEILGVEKKDLTCRKDHWSQWPAKTVRRVVFQRRRQRRSGFEKDSGVSGRQRWSQDERCLAQGRYTVPHNILVPAGPTRRPRQGASSTTEARRCRRNAAGVVRSPKK
ncbi:GD19240 [Drosophila simulans]|uniref:GD19240 n=1 Tax=Drosophila simulans TaxID=7240 RepID=B4NVI7_DROSI|nr:GD19240 [Drosophila simulans]